MSNTPPESVSLDRIVEILGGDYGLKVSQEGGQNYVLSKDFARPSAGGNARINASFSWREVY